MSVTEEPRTLAWVHAEYRVASSRNHGSMEAVAHGVSYLTTVFANLYLVQEDDTCVLVDTGLPGTAAFTRARVERALGGGRPDAIVLTHGHFDHAGSAAALADAWGIPIYAHPLELPYLTGQSDYAPKDPSMGGAIAQLARVFPTHGTDLGGRVRALPEDGSVPGLSGWRWIHTPGHTAGHVSLFRDAGRVLIAGDALTTMDLDSWMAVTLETPEIDRPPAPLTPDWDAARDSVERLAELAPATVGAGHGVPLSGEAATQGVRRLAERFPVPSGRYALRPARADQRGIVDVPPPVPDPLPARLAIGAVAVLAGIALARALRNRND
ncbi:MAG TPA: MBL fold metallo-hydrolase [Longimicrobium sp.]|jgi:glyoxylase-like metal-dependent hydrolase (beta-lactamase superfamily II)